MTVVAVLTFGLTPEVDAQEARDGEGTVASEESLPEDVFAGNVLKLTES